MLTQLLRYFSLLALSSTLQAQLFQAPLTDTHWQVIETPIKCTMSQSIDDFGEASFQQEAGKPLRLMFTTKFYPAVQNMVNFGVTQASWQNTQQPSFITSLPTQRGQTEFVLTGIFADKALTEIQQGRFPTLSYQSQNANEEISVLVSSVHLADSMPAFEQCVASLPTYSYEDISKLTVYFSLEKAELTPEAKAALRKLAHYVKLDDTIKRITISGHTDNHGRRRLNAALSDSRSIAIKNFLIEEAQLAESLITTSAHLEWDPVSTNKSTSGRALNRRAEVAVHR